MRMLRIFLSVCLLGCVLTAGHVYAQDEAAPAAAATVPAPEEGAAAQEQGQEAAPAAQVTDQTAAAEGEAQTEAGGSPAEGETAPEQRKPGASILKRFGMGMPEIPYYDEKLFEEKTNVLKKRPYSDDTFAYKVNIPKDWVLGEEKSSKNFMISDKLFIELNIFYGPPKIAGVSRLEIKAVNMEMDLTAEQWYLKYILESGYTLEGFYIYNDKKIESLMVIMEQDTPFYVRTIAHMNGKRMILAQYYLPAPYWEEEAAMQASVMKSFEMTRQIDEVIGTYEKFQFLDVAEVQYPSGWKAHAPPLKSVEKLGAKFLNTSNLAVEADVKASAVSAEGNVDVTLVAYTDGSSLISQVDEYKKALEGSGILVGKLLDEPLVIPVHDTASFYLSEIYEGIDSSSDFLEYELWFTVMVAGNYYYFITLLTPSREENFVAWARNTQGYKKIVSSLTPTTGAFMDRD